MIDLRDEGWLSWLKEADPFSYGYLSSDSPHHTIRLANGLKQLWSSMPPVIEDGDLIVGRTRTRGIGGFSFGSGIFCDTQEAERLKRTSPEWREYIDALVNFWTVRTPGSRIHLLEDEHLMSGQNVYWAGWGGHAILGYDELLEGGLDAIRKSIETLQTAEHDPEKRAFRESLLIVCDGIERFAANYAREAWRMANAEPDESRRIELTRIADRCSRVPKNGARTFAEAIQSFWFIHVLDGGDSPGRLDQFLFPYYKREIEAGTLSRSEAQNWMDHLWKRFNDIRSWNVCVGGLLPDGSDGTNDLTYMALEATKRSGKVAPNLSLRLHRNSPPELWEKAIEVIGTGVGMPALYNDDIMIPALMRYGIPEEECRDYAMNGCSQVDIQGRSHMGLEDGELDLLKCLELALHDGFDPYTKRQIGPKTGNPRQFETYDQLWQAYKKQVEFFTERMIAAANAVQQAHAETSPNLLRSLFVKDCIEKGIDFKAGGARYNHGQILTQGISNTADSLAALKKLVFEERRLNMADIIEQMDANFPDEGFRKMLINSAPKYGNDDEYVDRIAADVIEHFFSLLNSYRTWRGGVYGGGSIVFVRAVSFGSKVGATPDGRKASTPLSDSVGPTQGRDRLGPTAMFNSVSKVPQILAQSAYVLNVKFTGDVFSRGRDKIIRLFQTYFRRGGQQIQVNVVDRKTLIEAKKNPEQYSGLVVRVGGYSDYFVRLSPALQDDIIARTEQKV